MVAILKSNPTFAQIIHSGKKSKQTAGSHVTDIAELGRCLVLCMACEPKFDKYKYGYGQAKDIPIVRGKCDGCGHYVGCATFLRRMG